MQAQIWIINGPNLNLQGTREPEIYGSETFQDIVQSLQKKYPNVNIIFHQSNIEGELINWIQEAGFSAYGVILNAGGYTHTSVAIADAIAAITAPVIEVHISNIYNREVYRQNSLTAGKCVGLISGFGVKGYEMALQYFVGLSV